MHKVYFKFLIKLELDFRSLINRIFNGHVRANKNIQKKAKKLSELMFIWYKQTLPLSEACMNITISLSRCHVSSSYTKILILFVGLNRCFMYFYCFFFAKNDDGGRNDFVDGRKVIKILVIKLLLETQHR